MVVIFSAIKKMPAHLLMHCRDWNTTKSCYILIGCFILIGLFVHYAYAKETHERSPVSVPEGLSQLTDEDIQDEIKKYLGIRYKRAGVSKKGVDCSGFVKLIYDRIFGVDLPHQSSQQFRFSQLVNVREDSLRTGDLVFFSSGWKKKRINHVGIYLDDGKFIHSARSRGVVISDLHDPYWESRIIHSKRLVGRGIEDLSSGYQLHRMEFSYSEPVNNSIVSSITFFREYLLPVDQGRFSLDQPFYERPGQEKTFDAYAEGLRFSSNIKPFDNLNITPFLSYFDYGSRIDDTSLPKLMAGLDFNLYSSDDWSLTTGLMVSVNKYSADFRTWDEDDGAVGLSLTYRHKLLDRVHLSIRGENLISFTPNLTLYSPDLEKDDRRFNLMLNFYY